MNERGQSGFAVALGFLLLLGYSLFISQGHFNDLALILVSIGWVLFTVIFALPKKNPILGRANAEAWVQAALWVCLLYFTYKLLRNPMVIYVRSKSDQHLMKGFLWGSFGLALIGLGASLSARFRKAWEARYTKIICLLIFICFILARLFVLRASPHPWIDVWNTPTLGSAALLKGVNPYRIAYPDIYRGAYGYKAQYNYWPAVLLPETLFYAIFGDIRFTFIFCDILVFFVMRRILRGIGASESISWLMPLVWLSFPVSLFVLEQSWVDTLMIAGTACFALFLLEEKWTSAGIALGYTLAVKQYSLFLAILAACLVWLCVKKRSDFWKTGFVAAGTFLAFLAPFALADWKSFYECTFVNLLEQKMRSDALTWVAAYYNNTGQTLSGTVGAFAYAVITAFAVAVLIRLGSAASQTRRIYLWCYGLVVVYGIVFLMGKQAFCNYYYLLSFFVFLACAFALPRALNR